MRAPQRPEPQHPWPTARQHHLPSIASSKASSTTQYLSTQGMLVSVENAVRVAWTFQTLAAASLECWSASVRRLLQDARTRYMLHTCSASLRTINRQKKKRREKSQRERTPINEQDTSAHREAAWPRLSSTASTGAGSFPGSGDKSQNKQDRGGDCAPVLEGHPASLVLLSLRHVLSCILLLFVVLSTCFFFPLPSYPPTLLVPTHASPVSLHVLRTRQSLDMGPI